MTWFHTGVGQVSTFVLACIFCIQYYNICIQSKKQEKQRHVNKSNLVKGEYGEFAKETRLAC